MTDEYKFFMQRALNLALKARGMTSPNPMVGAVIVKDGKIVAGSYHKKTGEPHAEALVILKAKEDARNSTLYVTLEPCCHMDKKTPPCTKTIINAGIKKVVVAMKDPNPKVSGRGMKELKKYGIEVIEGILKDKAKKLNEAYMKYITTKIPFVILKAAMTLDGKIATPEGQSKWITGDKARNVVHQMRSEVDAILTAIGTVMADNPRLTVRAGVKEGQKAKNPKRVVIDPYLEIPIDYKILNVPPETIVVTKKAQRAITKNTEQRAKNKDRKQETEVRNQKIKVLIDRGVKITEYEGERLDLKWLMKSLGEIEITSVMIEGGSSLNSYAFWDGIVDKVIFFVAPKIIGGKDSISVIGGKMFQRLQDAYKIDNIKVKKVGEDLMIEGYMADRYQL